MVSKTEITKHTEPQPSQPIPYVQNILSNAARLYFNFHWYESRKVWFVISRKYVPNKGNQNGSVSHYLVHLLWNNFPKRKEIILECFCRIILLPSLNEIIQCFCKRLIFQKVFGFFLEKLKVTNNIFVFFYMVVSKTR